MGPFSGIIKKGKKSQKKCCHLACDLVLYQLFAVRNTERTKITTYIFHDDSHLESMQNIKKEIKKVVDKEH